MTGPAAVAAMLAGACVVVWTPRSRLGRDGRRVAGGMLRGGRSPLRRWRRGGVVGRRERARTAESLPLVCRTLAGELRAGAPPGAALAAAAEVSPTPLRAVLARASRAADVGGDPADALRATVPGGEGLLLLAACWEVATDVGAGLAGACDQIASVCEADLRARREVAAALAGPRASAVVLAALPGVGLLLALGLGAQPMAFLASGPGVACLAGGLVLDAAGVLWTRRLATGALR